MSEYIGSATARDTVRKDRRRLHSAETQLLESGGWIAKKSEYDGVVSWYHSGIGVISRASAIEIAMGGEWEWV